MSETTRFIDELEGEAREQLKAIREERAYGGKSPEYMKRAKVAIGIIGAYVRLRATLANEHTNALVERRLMREESALGEPANRKSLSA